MKRLFWIVLWVQFNQKIIIRGRQEAGFGDGGKDVEPRNAGGPFQLEKSRKQILRTSRKDCYSADSSISALEGFFCTSDF